MTFALHDRGIMTDGYRIYIEVQDFQGNYNGVEKEGKLEKNFAQKVWDTVSGWLNVVGAIVRAFIAWIIETAGPLIGILFGILVSLAKNIIDMIVGLPQMIAQLPEMLKMVDSFGAIFGNLGQVFEAMVQGIIDEAETILPASWTGCAKPTPSVLLQELIRFFSNPLGYAASCNRVLYDLSYVVGSIVGFVLGMVMGGAIAGLMTKLKTIEGFTKVTGKIKGALTKAPETAGAAATGVRNAVKSLGDTVSEGWLRITRQFGHMNLDEVQSKFLTGAIKSNRKNVDHIKHFSSRAEAEDVVKRTHLLSKTGKMDEAEAQKLLDKAIQSSKSDRAWKGSLNEIDMFGKYADDLPPGHKIKVNTGRGQGDALIHDSSDNLVAMREFKDWEVNKILDQKTMKDLADDAKRAAINHNLPTEKMVVEFRVSLSEAATIDDKIDDILRPFQKQGVGVAFVWV